MTTFAYLLTFTLTYIIGDAADWSSPSTLELVKGAIGLTSYSLLSLPRQRPRRCSIADLYPAISLVCRCCLTGLTYTRARGCATVPFSLKRDVAPFVARLAPEF
jgi:hypothetical protein